MNNSKTNHVAVVVSGVVYFLIGGLWFGVLFANAWIQAVGKSLQELEKTTMPPSVLYPVAFLTALILSYTINLILQRSGKQSAAEGVKLALLLWVGVVVTTVGPIFMFSGAPLRLFLIDTGYPLVAMIVSGAIVGGWTKTKESAIETQGSSKAKAVGA